VIVDVVLAVSETMPFGATAHWLMP
jgi:hypothetical protein